MNPEQEAAILRWRKRQIRAVAVGSLAAILFLVGLAMSSIVLLIFGLAVFLLSLIGIFIGGYLAARAARQSS